MPPSTERRSRNIPVAVDRREEKLPPIEYTDEESLFMKAMERYKRENRRPFPTWSEVLEVLSSLGYRKVAEETELPGTRREGGTEPVAPPKG